MPAIHEQHIDRLAIQDEAHARPPIAITSDRAQAWHWVLHQTVREDSDWPDGFDKAARHQIIERAEGLLRFERHTEFASITFVGRDVPSSDTLTLIKSCPGKQLAGARIVISEDVDFHDLFGSARLFGGEALFQGVTVVTDFQIADHGLVTFAVTGKFEDAFARGRLVKRLLDLETYRMASLLGLPLIRRFMPALERLEARASEATNALSQTDVLLEDVIIELSELSKQIAFLKGETAYRMAACYAYDELVSARLVSLNETPIGQCQTLRGFVEHRLGPGINSIKAFERRTNNVAGSVSQALALARTQLDHQAQRQSQALLESMEKRARQQVHLSQAVEGLSVAAITYYLVGLFGTALKAVPESVGSLHWVQTASIPVIAVLVWWNVRRAKSLMDRL